jgi:hypothetical protein
MTFGRDSDIGTGGKRFAKRSNGVGERDWIGCLVVFGSAGRMSPQQLKEFAVWL